MDDGFTLGVRQILKIIACELQNAENPIPRESLHHIKIGAWDNFFAKNAQRYKKNIFSLKNCMMMNTKIYIFSKMMQQRIKPV